MPLGLSYTRTDKTKERKVKGQRVCPFCCPFDFALDIGQWPRNYDFILILPRNTITIKYNPKINNAETNGTEEESPLGMEKLTEYLIYWGLKSQSHRMLIPRKSKTKAGANRLTLPKNLGTCLT